jgi:hypothetical protein
MTIDPSAGAEAVAMLKAGAAPEAVVDALAARGVDAGAAQAHVAQLVALKQQAERAASERGVDRDIQATLQAEAQRQGAAKSRNAVGCGALFLLAGAGALGLGWLGLSAPPEGRWAGTTMLGLGLGMLAVGALLLVAGLRGGRSLGDQAFFKRANSACAWGQRSIFAGSTRSRILKESRPLS